MIVDKELVVSNRKKADIVAELRKLKFRPFSKVLNAKASENEENEDEAAEEEEHGNDSDYDYLLGMPIWSLTKEKVNEMTNILNRLEINNICRSRNCDSKRKTRKASL